MDPAANKILERPIQAWREWPEPGCLLRAKRHQGRHARLLGQLAAAQSDRAAHPGALPRGSGVNGTVLHGATGWRLEFPSQTGPDWLAEFLRRLP